VRRLFLPAAISLLACALTTGLGIWQLERMVWKHGILAAIAAAEARPPIPLPAVPPPFAKVEATGMLRTDLAALYGAEGRDLPQGPVMGAQLVVPLERPGADTVLVVLGWVPGLPPATAPAPATVTGFIRPGEHPSLFSAKDDPTGRRFYTLDPAAIATGLGLRHVAPFFLVALGPTPPSGYPDPAHHLPRPPDNHLNYAITWFGLAVSGLAIFVIYARKVLRA
jgi:surfeit locus 1 family protein